jgi:hypothetical protein
MGGAAGALLLAKAWLAFAPGHAVRWATRIGTRGHRSRIVPTHRESLTGRGSRGFGFVLSRSYLLKDPRDPRPVETVTDQSHVETIRDLSAALSAIGRRAPFSATCLEQGVALVMLLSLARIPAHLVVGVSRSDATLRAHAWVECGGAMVLGGAQAQGLTPLLDTSPSSRLSAVGSSCPG